MGSALSRAWPPRRRPTNRGNPPPVFCFRWCATTSRRFERRRRISATGRACPASWSRSSAAFCSVAPSVPALRGSDAQAAGSTASSPFRVVWSSQLDDYPDGELLPSALSAFVAPHPGRDQPTTPDLIGVPHADQFAELLHSAKIDQHTGGGETGRAPSARSRQGTRRRRRGRAQSAGVVARRDRVAAEADRATHPLRLT